MSPNMRQALVKITFRWRKYAICTHLKMGPGPNRKFSNLLFHGICLSWCIFQGRIWIKAKNDKNTDKINSEMWFYVCYLFCNTFGPKIQCLVIPKIWYSGKNYFAHVFFICLPLIYLEKRKFRDHHYHDLPDSYRQWLLRNTKS